MALEVVLAVEIARSGPVVLVLELDSAGGATVSLGPEVLVIVSAELVSVIRVAVAVETV
jgi:hypothetical protein